MEYKVKSICQDRTKNCIKVQGIIHGENTAIVNLFTKVADKLLLEGQRKFHLLYNISGTLP